MLGGASYYFMKPLDEERMVERCVEIASSRIDVAASRHCKQPRRQAGGFGVMVTEIIHQIGVPAHIKGYHYLRDSIILVVEQPDSSTRSQNNCTPPWQKNRIRPPPGWSAPSATQLGGLDRGDVDTLNSYFGYTIHNGRASPPIPNLSR
jgi:two-component system response regulator (stage 0 sporulation protein A)